MLARLAAVGLLAGCVTSPTGRSQLILFSPENEVAKAHKLYASYVSSHQAQGKLLHDPVQTIRVKEIAGKLISVAMRIFPHTQNWHWSIILIDKPDEANAGCLAGGKIIIYSRLLYLTKDDELAQVIGHRT